MRQDGRFDAAALTATLRKATRDVAAEDIRAFLSARADDPAFIEAAAAVETDLARRDVAAFNQETRTPRSRQRHRSSGCARPHGPAARSPTVAARWYELKAGDPVEAGVCSAGARARAQGPTTPRVSISRLSARSGRRGL